MDSYGSIHDFDNLQFAHLGVAGPNHKSVQRNMVSALKDLITFIGTIVMVYDWYVANEVTFLELIDILMKDV